MILMRTNPLQGPLEGVGPENRVFLGPEIETSEASAKSWAFIIKSVQFNKADIYAGFDDLFILRLN